MTYSIREVKHEMQKAAERPDTGERRIGILGEKPTGEARMSRAERDIARAQAIRQTFSVKIKLTSK